MQRILTHTRARAHKIVYCFITDMSVYKVHSTVSDQHVFTLKTFQTALNKFGIKEFVHPIGVSRMRSLKMETAVGTFQ